MENNKSKKGQDLKVDTVTVEIQIPVVTWLGFNITPRKRLYATIKQLVAKIKDIATTNNWLSAELEALRNEKRIAEAERNFLQELLYQTPKKQLAGNVEGFEELKKELNFERKPTKKKTNLKKVKDSCVE